MPNVTVMSELTESVPSIDATSFLLLRPIIVERATEVNGCLIAFVLRAWWFVVFSHLPTPAERIPVLLQ